MSVVRKDELFALLDWADTGLDCTQVRSMPKSSQSVAAGQSEMGLRPGLDSGRPPLRALLRQARL